MNAPVSIAEKYQLMLASDENVPSPCISVCRMVPDTGLCQGCFRTIDEIRIWSKSDDATRREVWSRVASRSGLVTTEV